MLLWFFKLKKIQINQGVWAPACKICYKLLRKQCVLIVWAGRPDGKYLAHGDNLRTSLRLVHTAWPAEPNIFPSDPTLPVDTHLSVRLPSFSFFLSSYIFSSSHLAGTYAGLCDFSRPCSCHYVHFLYRDFFLSVIRTNKNQDQLNSPVSASCL